MHVFKDAYPPVAAGITRYVGDLAASSAARGADVEVLASGVRTPRVEARPDGVTIRRVREWGRALSMPLSPALVAETSRLEADIVHLHVPNPLAELGALRLRDAGALVVSFHAQLGKQRLLAPIFGPLQRAALRRCDRVFASSTTLASAPELRHVSDRVVLAPYGVSPQMVGGEPVARRRQGGPLKVLFVGRLVYYKGLDVLLDALERVPDTILTIVGDGAMREALAARIASNPDLTDRVTMIHDATDQEVIAQHQQHDVVVLPSVSRAEAFGLSMAEAMANGLPAVSTRLGTGTDWVNIDDVSGLVIEPGDATALASALRRMADDDDRSRWAAGALHRARSEFAFERHSDLIHDHYETALRGDTCRIQRPVLASESTSEAVA